MSETLEIHLCAEDEEYPHIDCLECWCGPDLVYEHELNHNQVWVHKSVGEVLVLAADIARTIASAIANRDEEYSQNNDA